MTHPSFPNDDSRPLRTARIENGPLIVR